MTVFENNAIDNYTSHINVSIQSSVTNRYPEVMEGTPHHI